MSEILASGPRIGSGVRAVSASVRIQCELREQIVGMRLVPGTPLSEKGIGEAFGVSRTPVREAILRLADERLVDIFPQYGTFVSRIRVDALREAMVIRAALERVTVREAAARVDAGSLDTLTVSLAAQRQADAALDLDAFYDTDEDFHLAIATIARHPHLWRVVRQEKAQVDRCRRLTLFLDRRRREVIAQHEAIASAIGTGDPDAAEAAMEAHLADVLPVIGAIQARHRDFFQGGEAPRLPRRRVEPALVPA